MVLRYRLTLILFLAMALYVGLAYFVQSQVVYPEFLKLEQDYADEDLERGMNAIEREIEYLNSFTHDWSAWDDTYEFIEDGNQDYVEANFVAETFTENSLSIMYAVRLDGTVVYGEVMDLETESYTTLSDLPQDKLPPGSMFILDPGDMVGKGGLTMLDGQPVIVSVMPIITTLSEGPSRGMLIFGKFIDAKVVETINEQTRVEMRLTPLDQARKDPELMDAVNAPVQPPFLQHVVSNNNRNVHGVFNDIDGEPAFLLSANISRFISKQGHDAVMHATISNAVASLFVVLLLIIATDLLFARRVSLLNQDVANIGLGGNLAARLPIRGNDEIGHLAKQINAMLTSLERMEKSRIASEKQAAELETIHSTTATYAHEINNPLTGILGIAQILLEDNMDSGACRELLGDIMEAAIRIRDVIHKMEKLTEVRFKPYFGSTELLDLDDKTLPPS